MKTVLNLKKSSVGDLKSGLYITEEFVLWDTIR